MNSTDGTLSSIRDQTRRRAAAPSRAEKLRAYRLPVGLAYTSLHDSLKAQGFVIYAGQGALSDSVFRISTMGNLTSVDIDRLVQCFSEAIPKVGSAATI